MSLSQESPPAEVSLVETVPTAVVQSSLRNFRRLLIWTVVAFYCLMTLLVARDAEVGFQSAMIGGLCLFLPSTLLALGLAAAMRHELTIRIPTVELKEDEVTVLYGKRVLNANVKDCRLHRGRAYMMRLPGCPRLHCYLPVILIDFPRSSLSRKTALLWGTRVRVVVGLSDEMRTKWEGALLAASEPERKARRRS